MEDKDFKQYKYAKSNLRTLPVLVLIGAVITIAGQVRGGSAMLQWYDYFDILTMAVAVVSAVGVLMWQHWARITLAVVIGVNMALMLVIGLLVLQVAGAQGANMVLGVIAVRLIFGAYFLSILLGKRGVEVMKHRGDLEALRASHTGFAQAVEAPA